MVFSHSPSSRRARSHESCCSHAASHAADHDEALAEALAADLDADHDADHDEDLDAALAADLDAAHAADHAADLAADLAARTNRQAGFDLILPFEDQDVPILRVDVDEGKLFSTPDIDYHDNGKGLP